MRHNFNFANAATVIVPNENALNALRNNRSVVTVSPEGVLRLFAKKPSAPTNLVAVANDPDVDLTWTDNSSGTGQEGGFEIQRCPGVGCSNFAQIFVTGPNGNGSAGYTDSGPGAGSYSYRVRATNAGAGPSSKWSNTDTVVVGGGGAVPPAAPSGLGAVLNDPDVDLTWTDNSSAPEQEGGFEIERCTGLGCGDFGQIFVTAPDATAYTDPNPGVGSHSYRVRATHAAVGPASDWSNIDTVVIAGGVPPAAPSGLAAGSTSDTSVSVGWVDNADNEDDFELERCTGGECTSFSPIATPAADTVLYSNTGLTASTAYRYRVRATNVDGSSAYSNIGDVTTAPPPGPPLPPPPNERGRRQQAPYGVIRVGLPTATSNGQGIGVAVVDTGIYFAHEDLNPAPDVPAVQTVAGVYSDGTSYNGSNEGVSATDLWGHGTHVAGRIAALDNNYGTLGVASHATLYAVKVDATPGGLIATSDVIAGLEWIKAKGPTLTPPIKVVNISSGGSDEGAVTELYHDIVIELYNMGIVVVVSAGNTPTVDVSTLFPAAWPETITVAATVASDGLSACNFFPWVPRVLSDTAASFTTDGVGVDISAPGAERTDAVGGCTGFFYGTLSTTSPSTDPPGPDEENGTYGRKMPAPNGWLEARGTSFAAPLVAGVAARILQDNPALDVEGVRSEIGNLADRVGPGPTAAPLDHPWDGIFGVTYTFDGQREGIAQAPE